MNRFVYFCLFFLLLVQPCFSEEIPLYWWQPGDFNNFGDELSPALIERMSGERVRMASKTKRGKLLAIGSILHEGQNGDTIWGSGVNGNMMNRARFYFKGAEIHAVRGPLSRKFLMEHQIDCPEVYGDPALLIPRFFPEFKKEAKRDYVVVPHYSDMELVADDEHVVLPTDSWREVVQQIIESRFVISSSLHGIIIAEAFGIPARLLRLSDHEPLFKYEDYYLGTGRESFKPAHSIEEAIEMGGEPPISIDLDALVDAFPFPLASQAR